MSEQPKILWQAGKVRVVARYRSPYRRFVIERAGVDSMGAVRWDADSEVSEEEGKSLGFDAHVWAIQQLDRARGQIERDRALIAAVFESMKGDYPSLFNEDGDLVATPPDSLKDRWKLLVSMRAAPGVGVEGDTL